MLDRPSVALLLSLSAWLALAGCSKQDAEDATAPTQEAQSPPQLPPAESKDQARKLQFAAYVSAAEIHSRLTDIDLTNPEHAALLSSGWNGPETEDGDAFAWIRKGLGTIEIPLVRPALLTLSMRMEPPPQPEMEARLENRLQWYQNYEVELSWNQHSLETFRLTADGLEVSLDVPVEYQQYGINLLQIQPSQWVKEGDRSISVRCSDIRLSYGRSEISPAENPVESEGEYIFQGPGTVLSEYFVLPEKSILKGKGTLEFESAETLKGLEGEVALNVTGTEGRTQTIFQRTLEEFSTSPEFAIEHELSSLDGDMAEFALSYSVQSGQDTAASELPKLVWKDLAIVGRVARPEVVGLAALRDRYNVFVILFDTLRADDIEPYGATVTRTPNMTALARQGVTFLNAHVNQPWTRGSIATMMTSTYPWVHGVIHNNSTLSPDLPYLPELLKAEGYKTLHVLHNSSVSERFGFIRGYDDFQQAWGDPVETDLGTLRSPEERADYTWDNFVDPFLLKASTNPFFIYLHEIDPHGPYTPAQPYGTMYDTGYRGSLDLTPTLMWLVLHNKTQLSSPEIDYLRSRYRGEISFMDDYLGRLLERMAGAGLRENTLLLFLSDHGEEFLEHGGVAHRTSLYEEMLNVPMIFSLPNALASDHKSKAPIEMVDVGPTILDLLDIDAAPGMQGRSMLPSLAGADIAQPQRPTFGHKGSSFAGKVESSVRFGRWKIYKRTVDRYVDGHYQYELFDLEKDPGEAINLWSRNIVRGRTLLQMLRHRLNVDDVAVGGSSGTVGESELDAETLENLGGLGYLL